MVKEHGNALSQLSLPEAVIVDQLGTLYIADTCNHRIVRWRKGATAGEVLVGGNGAGSRSDQLNWPTDLVFDRHCNLYVVDCLWIIVFNVLTCFSRHRHLLVTHVRLSSVRLFVFEFANKMPPNRIEFSPSYAHTHACARYIPDVETQRLTLRSHFHRTAIGQHFGVIVKKWTLPAYPKFPPCTLGPPHSTQDLILDRLNNSTIVDRLLSKKESKPISVETHASTYHTTVWKITGHCIEVNLKCRCEGSTKTSYHDGFRLVRISWMGRPKGMGPVWGWSVWPSRAPSFRSYALPFMYANWPKSFVVGALGASFTSISKIDKRKNIIDFCYKNYLRQYPSGKRKTTYQYRVPIGSKFMLYTHPQWRNDQSIP